MDNTSTSLSRKSILILLIKSKHLYNRADMKAKGQIILGYTYGFYGLQTYKDADTLQLQQDVDKELYGHSKVAASVLADQMIWEAAVAMEKFDEEQCKGLMELVVKEVGVEFKGLGEGFVEVH